MPPSVEPDTLLFGWDPTPGLLSVWADGEGRALLWRRVEGALRREEARFRPWLLASSLRDLEHLGPALGAAGQPRTERTLVRYRELEGPEGSLRFLLTAPSERALRRAALEGYARRTGRVARGLDELEGYYRVGPVEQYLMQSGRVLFRGLHFDDLQRLQVDLETTSLDPAQGELFLVAVRGSDGFEALLEAKELGGEKALLEALVALVRARDPDVLENHNLFGFDLPFLEHRAQVHGVPLALGREGAPPLLQRTRGEKGRRARYSVAGRELLDTLDAVRRHDFVTRELPGHGLKEVAKHFGLASAQREYVPGALLAKVYREDPARVRRYALDDVREVEALSRRLHRAPFALSAMVPRRLERVATAGPATGLLEPLLVRAYLHARRAPPARAPTEEGLPPHTGGALHLFATGVAERVVKADVASLYPSLMRAFRIGPSTDPLGAVVTLVSAMLERRLQHKDAARALAGTPEGGHHDALQSAMKLLLNSTYGYLGAGTLALFADRHAADEITRRGRETLATLVEALRVQGVTLLEADTDGVFFAVPEGCTERDERAVVARAGRALPEGLRLEFDGRYRAMFSHEVKNYALLTYDGRVLLRGAALRSSRSEPFGEAFLREALRLALLGEVVALREHFVATARALERRELPASAVATRARLSKSHEEYARTRERHREAPYEALLAAGAARWEPGARVRYYVARGGALAALPEPQDPAREDARDYDTQHYLRVLVANYASRLRKAFEPEDFAQLFRLDGQGSLFDRPLAQLTPRRAR